jgi:hypothetical protein
MSITLPTWCELSFGLAGWLIQLAVDGKNNTHFSMS